METPSESHAANLSYFQLIMILSEYFSETCNCEVEMSPNSQVVIQLHTQRAKLCILRLPSENQLLSGSS